ncbi:MAG: SGNH/GDSL hydrolase family protein [Acidimicrobiales bacterium]
MSTAGRSACGLDVCPNYHDRLITAAELVPDADVIVITGGVNDPTGTIVIDAVHATYSEARRLFPEATIVGFSPFGKATEYPESLVALRSIIRDEVSSVDGVYVDVGHPLADHPEWIRSDGLHPTDEGQHAGRGNPRRPAIPGARPGSVAEPTVRAGRRRSGGHPAGVDDQPRTWATNGPGRPRRLPRSRCPRWCRQPVMTAS